MKLELNENIILKKNQQTTKLDTDLSPECKVLRNYHVYVQACRKRVCSEKMFLFLNQNICCGYSKEPSQWDGSSEHPKHMLKMMDKKIFIILQSKFFLNWTYVCRTGWPKCAHLISFLRNNSNSIIKLHIFSRTFIAPRSS